MKVLNYSTSQVCYQIGKQTTTASTTIGDPTKPKSDKIIDRDVNDPLNVNKNKKPEGVMSNEEPVKSYQGTADQSKMSDRTYEQTPDGEQEASVIDRVKESAKHMADKVKETASSVADRVKETTHRMTHPNEKKDMSEKTDEIIDKTKEKWDQTKRQASDTWEKTKDKMDETKHKTKEKMDEAKEKVKDAWETTKHKASEVGDKAKDIGNAPFEKQNVPGTNKPNM